MNYQSYFRLLLAGLCLLAGRAVSFAQTTQGFAYQAVARDANGAILANQAINLEFILRASSASGPVVYQESHALNTGQNGLLTTVIGSGTPSLGLWSQIDWATEPIFLEVKIDGVTVTTEALEAVPYAKLATEMPLRGLTDVTATAPQSGEVLRWDGNSWTAAADQVDDADADPANELQTLTISGTQLSLSSGGGTVSIPQTTYTAGSGIAINSTTISNTGDTNAADDLTIGSSAGGDLAGTYPNPSVNRLRGRAVSNAVPGNGQVLAWNGNQWAPTAPPQSPWESAGTSIYYDAGDVGVGLTTPASNLHVHTPTTGSAALRLTNSNSGSTAADGLWLGYSALNAGYLFNYEATPLVFGTNNLEMMRLTATGLLGLGTANPTSKLQVNSDGSANQPQLTLFESGNNDFSRLRFQNSSGPTAWTLSGKTALSSASAVFSIDHSAGGDLITLTGNGRVGIREVTPTSDMHLKQSTTVWGSGGGLIFEEDGMSVDNWQLLHSGLHFSFVENNVRRAYVETATGNWVQPSDARLKTDVQPLAPVLARLLELEPVQYQYLGEGDRPLTLGFLAQDVVRHFPELRHESEDGYLGLAYRDFGILAVKAIQEQQEQLSAQQQRIEALEAQLVAQQQLLLELQQAVQRLQEE